MNKLVALFSFLLIPVAVFLIVNQPITEKPWIGYGFYSVFTEAWLVLALIVIGFMYISRFPGLRVLGALLSVVTIYSMTLQWGTFLSIRDSWRHLYWVTEGSFLPEIPYPAFHWYVDMVATTVGVSLPTVIMFAPLIAIVVGILCTVALSARFSDRHVEVIALGAFLLIPAVIVDFRGRPFAMLGALVLTGVLVAYIRVDTRWKGVALLTVLFASLISHPTIIFLLGIISAVAYAVRTADELADKRHLQGITPQYDLRYWGGIWLPILIFTLLAIHLMVFTALGRTTLIPALASLFMEGDSAGGGGASPLLLSQVAASLFDVIMRSSVFILTGCFALVGVAFADRNTVRQSAALVSLLSVAILVGSFVVIDVLSGLGMSPTRAIRIAPVALIPGVIVGLDELYERKPRMTRVTAMAVVLIGFAVLFSSPLIGTQQVASTSSDVERTNWVIDYESAGPVVESENTYEIAEAMYDSHTRDTLGNQWEYRFPHRNERYAWQVDAPEGSRVIIHDLSRRHAQAQSPEAAKNLDRFEQSNSKIYAGSGDAVYWTGAVVN